MSAKQRYLTDTPTLGGIHQKALLEATLYGLPMSGGRPPGRQELHAAGRAADRPLHHDP